MIILLLAGPTNAHLGWRNYELMLPGLDGRKALV